MSRSVFTIQEGNLTDRFLRSRSKIRIFGGGFANSKTSSACILAIHLARDYPGSNGLIARETVRKLNDTIRSEFYKWCPPGAIKQAPMNDKDSTTCTLNNGSKINFRYIQQQGKGQGQHTSNLLSATYDWVVIDQIEDPGIEYKDFLDILGRLRGDTPYIGDDDTMPRSGPRWLVLTSNPTRNWVYRKLVRPLHKFHETGYATDELLVVRDEQGDPISDADGKVVPLIELFEGSTYENESNLAPDFIRTLEATYTGTMRSRFLLGEWGSFEGLVYPEYDATQHQLPRAFMLEHFRRLHQAGIRPRVLDAFDFGIAKASCYLAGYIDLAGTVFITHGFYKPEMTPYNIVDGIIEARTALRAVTNVPLWCDPAIFRRTGLANGTIGPSTAETIRTAWADRVSEYSHTVAPTLNLRRGNNDILNGIIKVKGYLSIDSEVKHALTRKPGAPSIYFADELDFVDTEFTSYLWKIGVGTAEYTDEPVGNNDHAMDTIKYMLSKQADASALPKHLSGLDRTAFSVWHEDSSESMNTAKDGRYGRAA